MKVTFFFDHEARVEHVNVPVLPRLGDEVAFKHGPDHADLYRVRLVRLALIAGPPVKRQGYEVILTRKSPDPEPPA
jgi:hypothetical protein